MDGSGDILQATADAGRPGRDPCAAAPVASLIVCTIGRARELDRLFASLAQQSLRRFEVILVDQNPDDRLRAIVARHERQFAITHLKSEKGLSKARNAGLPWGNGAFIGFPDDDCWYEPTTLADVAQFFSDEPGFDIVSGRTLDQRGFESLSSFRRTSGPISRSNIWRSGNSSTLFVRRDVALRVAFDETLGVGAATPFKSGEESDFVLSAMALGKRAFFDRRLIVRHEQVDAQIGAPQLKRAWDYSAGFGYVLRKHDYGLFYLAYRLLRSLARCSMAAMALDLVQTRYRLTWTLGTLRGYFQLGASRQP